MQGLGCRGLGRVRGVKGLRGKGLGGLLGLGLR